ncbi:nitrous oxidase accessory protein [Saccharothrix sp. ALI-22-I]|uniref:right-handed parallel beta-helix repeat-containing protein n=1 Tax=Saccharothrix sp. ALI-22-I TaxID=1933778 RepID=UPI00097C27E8|nr:right-handed parallel beta-helix repeat-containing protein [Saccharothrix sp. ALI-22-I]ONI90731.1 nitrous oxidase accessory protein [Saccharothrix sp. ALI-22-I]
MPVIEAAAEISVQPGDSVQEALDTCAPGAVLRLAEGTYEGSLVIGRSDVALVGAGAGRTVIVPGPVAPTSVPPLHDAPADVVSGITVHDVSGVTVEGLTVRGFSGAGVYAHTATDLRLVDVESVGNVVWGLYVRESAEVEVLRCRAEGSQYGGITLAFCPAADALIADSEATANAFGVFVDNSSRARVLRNRSHGNAAGVLLLHQTYEGELPGGVADVLVADNDITGNTLASGGDEPGVLGFAGPPISGVGIGAIGVQRVAVVGNRVHGNEPGGPSVMGAGLVLASSADWGGSDSVDNSFEWNTITGNSPFDVQIGTDPGNQRFRNNVVGASQPEEIDGCGP